MAAGTKDAMGADVPTLNTRASLETVRRQAASVGSSPLLRDLLDAVPGVILILNEQRQTIFANRALGELLGLSSLDSVVGSRPGEILDCEHVLESAGGCGTSEACTTCGAAKAVSAAERGVACVQECRIIQKRSGRALDLRVSTTPMQLADNACSVLALSDISHEKRREVLEGIFFHDLLNTAGGVLGYARLMPSALPDKLEGLAASVLRLTNTLVEDIRAQRDLMAAENGDLIVRRESIGTGALLAEAAEAYRNHAVAAERQIVVDARAADASIESDRRLLLRVVGNMLKNALEACPAGQSVTLGCVADERDVEFWVHNPAGMPRTVQLQVFQRSFSTKGAGRGLGTYSIKLLTERYLRGSVSFASSHSDTTFRARFPRG